MKLGHKTSDFSPRFRHPTSDIRPLSSFTVNPEPLTESRIERLSLNPRGINRNETNRNDCYSQL